MQGTGGASETGSAEADENEAGLDAGEAARLLAQTQRRAQRDLDFRSPLLSLLAALVALIGFGVVWLSVRGQHPYKGPTAASLVVLYVLVAIRIGTVIYAQSRAGAGVSGRSVRLRRAEAAAVTAALLAVYLLMAALVNQGERRATFYWVYGVAATLIALGAVWAGCSAVREDWQGLGISVAVMLIAAIGALAGPRGMWLIDGIGCCLVLLANAGVLAWLPQASRPRR